MRIIECEQGSQEWLAARRGIPTASQFHKILTPKTGKPSAQAEALRIALVAEWMTGRDAESFQSDAMARGFMLEAEARQWYELTTGHEVRQTGICMRDDGMTGASPDGLIGDDGGLEIKCMLDAGHMAFLLQPDPKQFYPQIQGSLWITGREWWDLLAYHPDLPSLIVRVKRDQEYIEKLGPAVDAFIARMLADRKYLSETYRNDFAGAGTND
jgi:DNA-binding ferritin-like protein (Dps family)